MNRKSVRLLTLIAALGFAACGEDDVIVPGELEEAEAQDMVGVVLFATFNSSITPPSQPTPVAGGPAAVPFEFGADIETVVACPDGGDVAIMGEVVVEGDTESEAGRVEYGMSQVHNACVVTSDRGRTFTLWGNPGIEADFVVENDGQGLIEWGGSVVGTVDWQTDGREGTCQIAWEFSGSFNSDQSFDVMAAGTVCGVEVNREFRLG